MEENKLELNEACFGQEMINLKKIPTLVATWITPNA